MSKLLIDILKKRGNSRESYGVLSGIVGIVCNLVLCVFKFVVGTMSSSISITADAINNLSDMASSTVTIAGAKLSAKPVDKEHPFGHGRLEYISALAVSGLILLMGFELAKSSVEKIINPEPLKFGIIYIVVLSASILVKLWMAYFNARLYKETNNINLKTVRQDSLNDCIATLATIVSLVVSHFFGLAWIDGAIGLGVSVVILIGGIGIVKDIIGPLLGQAPDKQFVEDLEKTIMEPEMIVGVHDLIVHDYGPGRVIASAHAEVPSDVDIMEIHDVIDNVEKEIMKRFNTIICIHMDPIVVDDEEVERYRQMVTQVLNEYNSEYSFHDFRMVKGPTHTNLIFDLIVPFSDTDFKKICEDIKVLFKKRDDTIELVMTLEHPFV